MEQGLEKELKEIMGGLDCPKDFICYESGFKTLCKAQDIGLDTFLECLEERPGDCTFSLFARSTYFCQCPLRVYIFKKLGK
jgi:hypothetical protein